MIDPASVTANTQPPPVVPEELRINNQPAAFDDWDAAIRSPHTDIQNQSAEDCHNQRAR